MAVKHISANRVPMCFKIFYEVDACKARGCGIVIFEMAIFHYSLSNPSESVAQRIQLQFHLTGLTESEMPATSATRCKLLH